jgi:dipeptidyl aminopeptidase/acylaminoacyl peptidase
MKIKLGTQTLSPEEVVKKFLQAIIVRDEDFARVLMKNPPQIMTVSNPIKDLGTIEFIEKKGTFYKIENNIKTKLFDKGEIPKEILTDNFNAATLTYSPKTNTIFFIMQTDDRSQSRIISYDISKKEFKLIDSLKNTVISDIKIDSNGKYLAVLAYNDVSEQSNAYVYNLKAGEREDLRVKFKDTKTEGISPQFWQEDKLIFQIYLKDRFLYYVYDPYKDEILIP